MKEDGNHLKEELRGFASENWKSHWDRAVITILESYSTFIEVLLIYLCQEFRVSEFLLI